MDMRAIDTIVIKHQDSLGGTLSLLSKIQSKYGYLPQEALGRVAEATGRPLIDVFAVATFYRAFSLKPRGKHLIAVCLGTACHVRGAPKIVEEFSAQLQIKAGETTPDKKFTLETVNCLGACALGPTVVVDGRYYSHVTIADVRHIIAQARKGRKRPGAGDPRVFPLSVQCPKCHKSLMDSRTLLDGLPSIKLSVDAGAGRKNIAYLSSLYGSGLVRCESDIANGSLTLLSCPKCGKDLSSAADCLECGAKMAVMSVDGCAYLYICQRRGCPGHRLDLLGTSRMKPKPKQKSKPKLKTTLKPKVKARKKKKV
jgi:NADH-quinone oxidoreductase subunit E